LLHRESLADYLTKISCNCILECAARIWRSRIWKEFSKKKKRKKKEKRKRYIYIYIYIYMEGIRKNPCAFQKALAKHAAYFRMKTDSEVYIVIFGQN
jgi:hypothetical protein